jgi:predicted acylesterase/phospholipase RssA
VGITIVQKSDLSRVKPDAKKALVLAGGAISGGAFKLGGLVALNRFFGNFQVTDFDIYMGISAGAFLAAPLSAGIGPDELLKAIRGIHGRVTMFKPLDFYYPNWRELMARPAWLAEDLLAYGPRVAWALVRAIPRQRREIRERVDEFLEEPSLRTAEALLAPFVIELLKRPWGRRGSYLPSGIFDNNRIEAYIRRNLEANGLPNNFRQLKLTTGRSLYIGATNLNTAQGVVFGHDEDTSVTISEAVQASTAIPGFFKPARVGPPGREQDYCDAAIRRTANISTAVRHGAQLVICYNPFRPFVNYRHGMLDEHRRSIADLGIYAVLNQAFRTLLHSRLRLGIEKLRLDESFKGDAIIIEPAETDARFFAINPLAFWRREEAAIHGFYSVRSSLERHYEPVRKVLAAYGLEVEIQGLERGLEEELWPAAARREKAAGAEAKSRRFPPLRLVSASR